MAEADVSPNNAAREPRRYPHVTIVTGASGRRRGILSWEPTPQTRLSGLEPWCYSWQCLDGRGWPLVAEEEGALIRSLQRSAGKLRELPKPTRDAITALLSSMRCGVETRDLSVVLPGVGAAQFVAAHRALAAKLAPARQAWEEILADPSVAVLRRHGRAAAALCPVPLQLLSGAEQLLTGFEDIPASELRAWGERTRVEMAAVRQEADELEEALSHFTRPSAEAVELGRLLYDPRTPSLWADPYFIPRRVGELSPVRVAALLGERRRRPR